MSAKGTKNTQHKKGERTDRRLDPGRGGHEYGACHGNGNGMDSFANLMYGCIDGSTDWWMNGWMAGWLVGLVGLVGGQAGLCGLVDWFGWLAGWRLGSVKLVLIISFHYFFF